MTRFCHFVAENQTKWDIFVHPLTYAYNSRVHSSTDSTLFRLFLSRNPPLPPSFDGNSTFSPITYYAMEPHALRAQFLARVQALRAHLNTRLALVQSRYKRSYDKNVKRTPVFSPGKLVYNKKTPLATFSVEVADSMTITTDNELVPKALQPSLIVKSNDHTLVIDEKRLHSTISIQRATLGPRQDTASVLSSSPLLISSPAKEPDSEETPTDYS